MSAQEDVMDYRQDGNRIQRISRRGFIVTAAAAVSAVVYRSAFHVGGVEAKASLPKEVKIVDFSSSGKQQGVVTVPTITKTDADWKQQLPAISYSITRQAGTERAYTGPYWNLHDKGLYRCICCDTAVFSSETKFESGTGWPSFWQPIAKENVREETDMSLGMERTAVSCRRCDAHLGHVFDDGPRPTGLRYCMNSVAMKFVKFA
jgi:peptide-methionine (R)-S-oxide reductase